MGCVRVDPKELEWDYLKRTCNDQEMLECEKLYHYYCDEGTFTRLQPRSEIMDLVHAFYATPFIDRKDPIYDCILIRKEVRTFIRGLESLLKMAYTRSSSEESNNGW